jgi:hypothetical protein
MVNRERFLGNRWARAQEMDGGEDTRAEQRSLRDQEPVNWISAVEHEIQESNIFGWTAQELCVIRVPTAAEPIDDATYLLSGQRPGSVRFSRTA